MANAVGDDLSTFLAELRVLQRAADVLGVPVKDLIDLRKSRLDARNARAEYAAPASLQNGSVHSSSTLPTASHQNGGIHPSSSLPAVHHQTGNTHPSSVLPTALEAQWPADNFGLHEFGAPANAHTPNFSHPTAASGPVPALHSATNGSSANQVALEEMLPANTAANSSLQQPVNGAGGVIVAQRVYPSPSEEDDDVEGPHGAQMNVIEGWPLLNPELNLATDIASEGSNLRNDGIAQQDVIGPNFAVYANTGWEQVVAYDPLPSAESGFILEQPDLFTMPGNQDNFDGNSTTDIWAPFGPYIEEASDPPVTSSELQEESGPMPIGLPTEKPTTPTPRGPITSLRDIQPRINPPEDPLRPLRANTTNDLSGPAPASVALTSISIQKRKRRGAFSPCQRLQTSATRKSKACIRCHMQRIRCLPNPDDPFGDCLTCAKLKGPTLSQLPCLRYKISDSQLLDKGPHPRFSWTRRWTSMKICEIEAWVAPDIKTITLTQDVGIASYILRVREFVPVEGDSMVRTWNAPDGVRSHPCAPYAIANMHEASQTFLDFVDDHVETFLEYYIDRADTLLSKTYQMALHHSRSSQVKEERTLLHSVLRLWVASRMESKQERISSEEVLNMTPQDWDPDASNYGKYLVPPVMQAQIEILTTSMILLPMKQEVLRTMQKLVEKNLVRSWFTIYLTLFVLLHSCAMLTRAEAVRAAREGKIGAQSRFYNHQVVEEFHSGARTMLAYFHYCNKGSHPFAMDWTRVANWTFAELNASQVEFLKETVDLVKEKRLHFEHIKQDKLFEDDYYFISQLYDLHWAPVHTV